MKEKPPKKLTDVWTKRLKEEGLSEIKKPFKAPLELSSAKEILMALDPEVDKYLKQLQDLNGLKIKRNIFNDLNDKRKEGISPIEILKRFKILVGKSQEFEKMSAADSDKKHKLSKPTEEKREEDKYAEIVVEDLLEKMKRILEKEDPDGGKQKEHIN